MIFFNYTVPETFRSDGCTFAKDTWGSFTITPACRFHDFLRRFGLERRMVADFLGAKAIAQILPWWGVPIAAIYFLGMEWGSFWEWISELRQEYRYRPFPEEWRSYLPDDHKFR